MVTRRGAVLVSIATIAVATIGSRASADAPPPPAPKPIDTTLGAPPAAAAPSAEVVPIGAPTTGVPRVHHTPISVARPHEPLDISAEIELPHLAKRVVLVYRASTHVREVPFLRSAEGWAARIPEEDVNPPGFGYAIEVETTAGARKPVFASRSAMHEVQVAEDVDDIRERMLLARLDNKRSIVLASFDYVYYGRTQATGGPPGTTGPFTVRDHYLRAEAAYFYRPLRFVVEFGIRAGLVRGLSPIGNEPGKRVGLNYAAPTALFRMSDRFHLEVSLLSSVTEEGFATGVGSALHIGDPIGSKLILAFDTVKTFGSRGWARLDIVRDRLRVSPVVEVGDIPNARAGVRLFTEVAYRFANGFYAAGRFGYQARDFTSGGPGGGLALGHSF